MALITKSIANATKVTASPEELTQIQSGYTGSVSKIPKAASTAISGTILGSSGIPTASLTGGVSQINSYLQSSLTSITSTFSNAVKGLASGLDSTLSGLFKDTNVKTASTITSLISDPIKTNFVDTKIPTSSAFKITSFEAGSQAISMTGASSQFGSNADSMIGTSLSTIMNRFNLDSSSGLASSITGSNSSSSLKSLFSTVGSLTKSVSGVAQTVQAISQIPNQLTQSLTRSINNEIQALTGRSGTLTNLTGVDASSFYLGTGTLTLQDQNGNLVSTTGSGTDSTTANALLSIARLIGCDTSNVTEYSSVNELASLFNMILSLASQQGLSSLVNSLLGCSMATTVYGQTAVTNAFTSVAGSDLTIASSLLGQITNPLTLNNPTLTRSIVSNPNLTAADTATLETLLAQLGATPLSAYETTTVDSSLVMYDVNTLSSSEKSILDSLFGDTTLSTYLNGSVVSLQADGTYWV